MSGESSQDTLDQAKLDAVKAQTGIAKDFVGLANKADARQQKSYDLTFPYYSDRLHNGLPYFNALTDAQGGLAHQAFGPQRGALERRLSSFGDLPSGFAEGARQDLGAQEAQMFDNGLIASLAANEQAKQQAAAGASGQMAYFNPGQGFAGASNAYGQVIGAPNFQNNGSSGAGAGGGAVAGLLQTFF